jgi:hypothetical protein
LRKARVLPIDIQLEQLLGHLGAFHEALKDHKAKAYVTDAKAKLMMACSQQLAQDRREGRLSHREIKQLVKAKLDNPEEVPAKRPKPLIKHNPAGYRAYRPNTLEEEMLMGLSPADRLAHLKEKKG